MNQSPSTDYLVAAQDLYLTLRGGGLVLSPLDLDRIRRWRDEGLPLQLVLEAIRRAHRAWHDAGRISRSRPFLLRHAEPHVEELARIQARRAPGGFPTSHSAPGARNAPREGAAPGADTPTTIGGTAAGGGGGAPVGGWPTPGVASAASVSPPGAPVQTWQTRARSRLEALIEQQAGPIRVAYEAALTALESGADLLVVDELQARAYLQALPRPEQRHLGHRAREASGQRAGIPRSSYRAMLRAYLWEAARTHGQLLRPSDLS